MQNTALVCIDMQNDFVLPTGSLSVGKAEEIVPVFNSIRDKFPLVILTQDWHPKNHVSFYTNHPGKKAFEIVDAGSVKQMLFNPHCVQDTDGAKIHKGLTIKPNDLIVHKGTSSDVDSYSCFFDVIQSNKTEAHELLQKAGVKTLYFLGVATDYCVKFSVLDALKLGYKVYVIENGIHAVSDADGKTAIEEMKSKGATFIHSSKF
jgi:nicotinamidase/pyrazinamidase